MRRRLVVTGRVQGVWFRDSCRDEAERLGVTGWVRNRADGAVEIEAEGEPAAVAALESWAHRGPPRAAVEGVYGDDVEPVGGGRFELRP